MDGNILNTSKAIDGPFADLKNKLRNHNGLSEKRKRKFIDEFLEVLYIIPGKLLPRRDRFRLYRRHKEKTYLSVIKYRAKKQHQKGALLLFYA